MLIDLRQPYAQLDFVLVQRYSSAPVQDTPQDGLPTELVPASKQVGVHPRILTVQRLHPSMVALRVLRRFSYTEPDIFAQYEKLFSVYDTAEWSEQYFNSRALFSEEMERQDVTIDASKLTDLNLLKRRVLKNCIYGVDLNLMAVELAKVSL